MSFSTDFTEYYFYSIMDVTFSVRNICGAFNKFPDIFVPAFKIIVDS